MTKKNKKGSTKIKIMTKTETKTKKKRTRKIRTTIKTNKKLEIERRRRNIYERGEIRGKRTNNMKQRKEEAP